MVEQQVETLVNKPNQASELSQLELGRELQQQNKLDQAEQCFREVIANRPRHWKAYESLANLFYVSGDIESAIEVYRLGADNNSEHPSYLLAIGKLLSEQKKWQLANKYFHEALKNDPATPWGYLNWAKVLVELNSWQKARKITIKAIKLRPDLWEAHYHLGKILQHDQHWQAALQAYRAAIELRPNCMRCYLQIAEIHLRLEQFKKAKSAYEYVITNAEEQLSVQYQAIELYLQQLVDHPDTVAKDFQELGNLCLERGFLPQAVTAYQHCFVDDSDNAAISPQTISFCFQQLASLSNATARDYSELGNLCRTYGYFTQAISACQEAIRLDPQGESPYIRIQYTKVGAEENKKLIEFYRQLLAKESNLPLAWGGLGDALSQQGEIGEAISCYQNSCYQRVTKRYPELAKFDWKKPKQKNPNFIIFGSAKCGTTALYLYLSRHSQMLLPHKKELDFFWQHYDRGMDWYLANFPAITDREDFFTGEASPNYIRFPQVAQRIKAHCPESKLIVLLRNPVKRAISWHYHKVNSGLATGSLEEAIATELKQLENISEAELQKGGYRKVDNIYSSLYYYQLQPWLENFPREQFLFLKSEDFYGNTAEVMNQVFEFIGVAPQQLAEYPTVHKGSYSKVDDQISQQLKKYFRPYNQKLEELLEMEFDWS